jgi:hypothetical protein
MLAGGVLYIAGALVVSPALAERLSNGPRLPRGLSRLRLRRRGVPVHRDSTAHHLNLPLRAPSFPVYPERTRPSPLRLLCGHEVEALNANGRRRSPGHSFRLYSRCWTRPKAHLIPGPYGGRFATGVQYGPRTLSKNPYSAGWIFAIRASNHRARSAGGSVDARPDIQPVPAVARAIIFTCLMRRPRAPLGSGTRSFWPAT